MNVKTLITKEYLIEKEDLTAERSYNCDNEYWYISTLIAASRDLEPFDFDLKSIDLDRMPWKIDSVGIFLSHCIDIEDVDSKHPIIMAPYGWVMNGWHRICRAILNGEETIPAVRFVKLPKADGKVE